MTDIDLTAQQADAARKIEALMLQGLAANGQKNVAQALGLSESTVSRWKDGDLYKMALSLVAMGLKAVPADAEMIRREDLQALIHGHQEWAKSLSAAQLVSRASGE